MFRYFQPRVNTAKSGLTRDASGADVAHAFAERSIMFDGFSDADHVRTDGRRLQRGWWRNGATGREEVARESGERQLQSRESFSLDTPV